MPFVTGNHLLLLLPPPARALLLVVVLLAAAAARLLLLLQARRLVALPLLRVRPLVLPVRTRARRPLHLLPDLMPDIRDTSTRSMMIT